MPCILIFCIVGSYAVNNSLFDVGFMLGFGVLAFVLEESGFPCSSPAILGVILGSMLENHFVTTMISSGGDLTALVSLADSGSSRHHCRSYMVRATAPEADRSP